MAPTARQVPKGQPGFSARKTKKDHVSLADDSVEEAEETLAGGGKRIAAAFATASSSSEESSPSSPPRKRRQTRATKSASSGDTFDDSTDDGLSPLLPTCHPKANATAAAPIDVDNFDHYFGDEEIGDPFDDPDEDDVQAIAVERLTSSKTPYKKVEKQTVFRNALLVKKSSLLGPNPPQEVDDIYEMWSVSTRSHKTWDIATIARPMLLLGKYLYKLHKEGNLTTRASAAESLYTLYRHFHCIAMQEVETRKARNRKILSKVKNASTKTKKGKTIPKHIDPITVHRSKEISDCMECGCKGTVAEIDTEEELEERRAEWENDYKERKKKNKNARRTGEPQMRFACMCPRSKTMRGDWANSSCLDCRMRGRADPDCKSCNCDCTDEYFTMADVQQKALRGMQKRNNNAKEQKKQLNGGEVLGGILKDSMEEVTNLLKEGNSNLSTKDAMTMAANRLKHKQFRSEHDMHMVQKIVGVPGTKLLSGEDVRSGVQQRNKKEYQNNLSVVINASEKTAAQERAESAAYEDDVRKATALSLQHQSNFIEDLTKDSPPIYDNPLDERKPAAVPKPAMPAPMPRTKAERQEEIKERVVNQLDKLADDGTPNTEEASMEMLDYLCSKDENKYQLIVKSKAVKGTPAEGTSPQIAATLVNRLKSTKKGNSNN